MPSGIVPHGQERPNATTRHIQARKTNQAKTQATKRPTHQTTLPSLDDLEIEWVMGKTLLDILALSRRYIGLHGVLAEHRANGRPVSPIADYDPQIVIASLVACAKFPDSVPELAGLIARTAKLEQALRGEPREPRERGNA